MSDAHLLLVSLGPVQDFIAQARRSRDLWFGSHLLSELSRAAASRLAAAGALLIFPALDNGDPELGPCDAPTRADERPPISVANKILAEVPAEIDPRGCAESARQAVRERWRTIAQSVRNGRGKPLLAAGVDIDAVWDEQVADILEFYAVWVPLVGAYKDARQAAEQALAGRKNLRDFRPWRHDCAGAPKSSLDGARVSVLKRNRSAAGFRRLRIAEGEQLDAIGLIKRAGFEPEQFVPLVNVAAGPWLRQAAETACEELARLRQACRAREIPAIRSPLPVVAPLPFDASVLYPSRWTALFKELDPPETDAAVARAWGEQHVRPLLKGMKSEPPAYVACLAADGDHIGRAIDSLPSAAANREFSRALARFPGEAREIVEGAEHCGSLIYAGGDDVLAFLPAATAPACADALRRAFRKRLKAGVSAEIVLTLSVGIAVGHATEAMSVLLALARRAERAAKDAGGDALAVIVDKRSGGERQLALSWKDDPLARLRHDAGLLKEKLSTGKAHELETLMRRFPDPRCTAVGPEAAQALVGYAEDILAHTGESEATSLSDLGVEPQADYVALRRALATAIDRILIVRSLREAGFR
ncbi:MAG: type III-B CRISPR-associated protein Cas10/Cmr2 [Stellaceae bacterium]